MISIKNLHKFFNKGKQNEIHVINDVTLDLPERGMTAIFGKSGCGKTTLLNVIGGLDSFAEGSLTIKGQSIGKNTDEIRNKYIGYIFQNYNLNNNDSCFDNVASALRLCGMRDEDEIKRRVEIALKNVGMEKYGRRTPDTLSGGQQQRIAIARAIVKNPPIILADEPTGNLDEANTIMIMDLLREIARDHLVLLVTHEESLVDAYCNKIIELSDGKIISVREGRADGSVSGRSKQDIYLGELTKTEVKTPEISLEYYGETSEPVEIKIVNKDGRLYLKLGTERVHIIDGTGEVRLLDGVYQEREGKDSAPFDMSALPTVSGDKFGRLFDLKNSVKSSYKRTFKAHSKGNKALRTMLRLFAAVTVLISAVFGSAIGQILDASDSYNHNTFYVSCENPSASEIIMGGLGNSNSAIDFISNYAYYPDGDDYLDFHMASFETFNQPIYNSGLNTHGVVLGISLTDGLELLAGSREMPSGEYILISDKVADDLLKKTPLGYMTDYTDLIGLTCSSYNLNGKSLRVGGIVKSGEYAIYLDEMTMARYALRGSYTRVLPASDFGIPLDEGTAVIAVGESSMASAAPKLGENIKLNGHTVSVGDVKVHSDFYDEWLNLNGIVKLSRDEYFLGSTEAQINERYFEYDEYYYDQLDSFIRDSYIVSQGNITPWLYVEKGVDVRPVYYSADYYLALEFKAKNGRFPTKAEYDSTLAGLPGFDYEEYYRIQDQYVNEFYSSGKDSIYYTTALVSDEDYIKISKTYGDSHPSICEGVEFVRYLLVHSSDPALTEAWLTEKLGHIPDGQYYKTIITPDDVMDEVISEHSETITGTLIALISILVVMAVCMYFIMRASLMSRIREVGIYRAIGVSKKNILFRFGVESALLSLLTVMVGYIATSVIIGLSLGLSPMVEEIFFYPPWYALIVLLILGAMSLVSGLLPVLGLLGKTPSEILAKYDV